MDDPRQSAAARRMAAAVKKFAVTYAAEFETEAEGEGDEHRLILKRIPGRPAVRFRCGEAANSRDARDLCRWRLEWEQQHGQEGFVPTGERAWHSVSTNFMEQPVEVHYVPSLRASRSDSGTHGFLSIRDLLLQHRADAELVRSFHALKPLFNNLASIMLRTR